MSNWIEELRYKRIGEGEKKKGKWHPDSFKDRNSIQEAIEEGIDQMSYVEMAFMEKKISLTIRDLLFDQIIDILELLKSINTTQLSGKNTH